MHFLRAQYIPTAFDFVDVLQLLLRLHVPAQNAKEPIK